MSAPLASCRSPVAPAPARRVNLLAVAGKSMRLAMMLVLVVLGALLVATYREMLHETPAVAPPVRAEAAADVPLLDLLRPGGWVLGDSTWTVALTDLSDPASAARLKSLGRPRTVDQKAAPLEATLLAWLRRSRSQVVENCRVYDLPVGATRVRAVTEGSGKSERLRLVQVIWRQGNRPPQLLQAAPAPQGAGRGMSEEHLLPLPQGAMVLARRCDDAGALSAEVIRCPTPWKECLRGWTEAGWSVQTLAPAKASVPVVFLRQGERKLHLCPLQGGAEGVAGVVLVTAANSSPSQGNP